MRRHKGNLLASGSVLALFGAAMMLTPVSAFSQTSSPGETSAQAPAATTPAETKADEANIDNLVPVPDTSNVPPPTAADIGPLAAPAAPAVTVATPAPEAPAAATAESKPAETPATAQSEPAATPATTTLSAADQAIVDKLKELVTTKAGKYFDRKNERAAVEAFYRDRSYAPLWIDNGQANARANSVVSYLKTVDSDGLDPSEYATPEIKAGLDADALADAELKLTDAALTFARHAATGRVSFTRISNDIYYDLDFPAPASILKKLTDAGNAGETLASYLPQDPAYEALKKKYAEERAKTDSPSKPRIAEGRLLKLDEKNPIEDPRVPVLRKALGVAENTDSPLYDKTVADAVKKFQAAHKMTADGILGRATVSAINGPRHDKIVDTILVNLERWRWLPHQLSGASGAYVMVNIPDYSLKIVRHGVEYWKTKIVVGKPGKETPLISPTMKYITVNPTWNVPPSIIAKEYLPALREDPTALDRIGLKLEQNKDGTVRIYQPPGERNALGRIRFNFPNKFLVYQHDTPDKYLFKKDTRAYSHGCMRVENPVTYGEKLLSIELPNEHYSEAKIKSMFGNSEININFPKPLPVHMTYQTAFVDEAGKLQIRPDIYGHDARMLRALKTDERKVADIAVEQRGVGSATISRDELVYEDRSTSPAFENPFLNLFRPREAPRPYGRNARNERNDRYDRRYERRDAREGPPNFFDIFR
jgi:murein L,D-transpeptidase YcbB/YkuD